MEKTISHFNHIFAPEIFRILDDANFALSHISPAHQVQVHVSTTHCAAKNTDERLRMVFYHSIYVSEGEEPCSNRLLATAVKSWAKGSSDLPNPSTCQTADIVLPCSAKCIHLSSSTF